MMELVYVSSSNGEFYGFDPRSGYKKNNLTCIIKKIYISLYYEKNI